MVLKRATDYMGNHAKPVMVAHFAGSHPAKG
jgi:hypothetical protein